jgi:hypothetical protein
MSTDLILDQDGGITIELQAQHAVKATSSDFLLDSPHRRKDATPAERRALVHDFGDALTLNYAGDYPGGVRITGPVTLTEPVTVKGHLVVDGPITFYHNITQEVSFDAPRALGGSGRKERRTIASPVDLDGYLDMSLGDLRKLITDLTARVAAIEAKPH